MITIDQPPQIRHQRPQTVEYPGSAGSDPIAGYVTIKTFAAALRSLVFEELTPVLEGSGRKLSETEAYPFSRPAFTAQKAIFNLVAADNEFERDRYNAPPRTLDPGQSLSAPPMSRRNGGYSSRSSRT